MARLAILAVTVGLLLAFGAGAAFAASLVGTDGPDVLKGTKQDDRIFGGRGNDTITGGSGEDVVQAGRGNDFVSVGYEDDRITPDRVNCGPGRDTIKLTKLKIAQRDVYKNCEKTVF
jgi:Ca2+-binding RTX toxin-like protein